MNIAWISLVLSILMIILSIIILIKIKKCNSENYSAIFPEPDKRVLKGSFGCAYSLGGGNTAYCNDWITMHRQGKLCNTDQGCHPNLFGKIDCKGALDCCNQIATCGNGHDCRDKKYMPTKENDLMYDRNINLDE